MIEAQARELIESMTAWDSAPALTWAQVTLLVRAARRPDRDGVEPTVHDEWAPLTGYDAGDMVFPTERNGHVYTVTVAGESAASEPAWPTVSDATVENGTVTFSEAGAVWSGTYDLNAAAAEGWRWKAAAAAGKFSFSTDGQSFNRQEIARAALEMAAMYRSRVVGSIPLVLTDGGTDIVGNVNA